MDSRRVQRIAVAASVSLLFFYRLSLWSLHDGHPRTAAGLGGTPDRRAHALSCINSIADSEIELLENRCETLLVFDYLENGFGGSVGFIINNMMYQARMNHSADYLGVWHYAKGCPFEAGDEGASCFCQPLTPCNRSRTRWSPRPGSKDWYHDDIDKLENYPEPYRRMGIPYWRSRFTSRFFRLNRNVAAIFQATKKSINWPKDRAVLAIHIRQGDKAKEGYRLFSAQQYLEHALKIQRDYRVADVFLATDSPTVLKECFDLFGPFFNIMALNDSRRLGDTSIEVASFAKNQSDSWTLGLDAILNLQFMSEANFFIGTVHSNFGRMAAELMFAKNNLRGPMIFLDKPECDKGRHVHPDIEAYMAFNRSHFYDLACDVSNAFDACQPCHHGH